MGDSLLQRGEPPRPGPAEVGTMIDTDIVMVDLGSGVSVWLFSNNFLSHLIAIEFFWVHSLE